MKIIDRYLLKRFLGLLITIIIACQSLWVFLDIISNLDRYLATTVHYTVLYYLYLLPYISGVVFPIAMLLAGMFTTGILATHNEINAMHAAGISVGRIMAPLFIVSLLICLGILAFNGTWMPEFNRKKTDIYNYKIKNRSPDANVVKRNLCYEGKNDVIYHFSEFDGRSNKGKNVSIEIFKNHRLYKKYKAESLVWENHTWALVKGTEIRFEGDGMNFSRFERLGGLPFADVPEDFLVTPKFPDDMNFFELRRYIDQIRRSGGKPDKYEADLYFKISFPLINLIVVFLGVSLTTRVARRGMAKVLGLGLLISFTYYLLAKLGLAFGHSGYIQPLLAAWMGNITFSILGIILYIRASR
jgi:lipopolysaccharide export system permease protein